MLYRGHENEFANTSPLLYICYTADLTGILTLEGLLVHQQADDTKVFTHGSASAAALLVKRILEVTKSLDLWMSSNHLCPNPDKNQFIWLGG